MSVNYLHSIAVSTRRRFDVHTTSITLKRRHADVKTTSCPYWDRSDIDHLISQSFKFLSYLDFGFQAIDWIFDRTHHWPSHYINRLTNSVKIKNLVSIITKLYKTALSIPKLESVRESVNDFQNKLRTSFLQEIV